LFIQVLEIRTSIHIITPLASFPYQLKMPVQSQPEARPTLASAIAKAVNHGEKKVQPWKSFHSSQDVEYSTESRENCFRLQKEGCPIGLGG